MKITLLSVAYPYRGGIAQFNTRLFRELSKEHQVQAVTFKRQYPGLLFPGKTQQVSENDEVEKIPTLRLVDSVNPLSYFKTAKKITDFGPEVFISRYWMSFFAPSFGTIAKKLPKSVKRIAILDNVVPHEPKFFDKPFTRYFLNQHEGFIVLSDAVAQDLKKFRPDAKYLKIDHPIYDQFGEKLNREEALNKLGIDPSKKILLFFGFIRDYKGLDILLESLAQLDNSYQLIIAGETYGSFDKYQAIIDRNDLSERIHRFDKYIDDQSVNLYFSAADVLMLPYRSATQSGISPVALHFELPSIATDVGGLKEVIRNGETGIIVEKPDAQLLAEAAKRYFSEGLAQKFHEELKKEREKFSWPAFSARLLKFIEELPSRKK